MDEIKIGDVVTVRKPSDDQFMYIGISGCEVTQIKDGHALLYLQRYDQEMEAPLDHLTKE
jgi:hypothetical protein